jgi:hypothetical protein
MCAMAPPSRAADYLVPDDFATIQAAVAAAAAGFDPTNTITIKTSPIITAASITIGGGSFNAGHTLTIRPASTLGRATVASSSGAVVLFAIADVGYVTLQDLDIIRSATNFQNLVQVDRSDSIIFERCRIGSNWTTPGAPDKSLMRLTYPKDNIIRNCILFSYFRGTFDRGIYATNFTDDRRSLFLYNNDVSDYKLYGIEIDESGAAPPAALVLLRNNVCVNHPDFAAAAEPHGWKTWCDEIEVVKSNNVAFATDAAHVEEPAFAGVVSLSGIDNPVAWAFERFDRPQVDDAFLSRTWVIAPPWDPNTSFYDLDPDKANPLHDGPEDYGMTVLNGVPHARDRGVFDDIDRQIRPGGEPAHFDRGADQVDPGISLAVGQPGAGRRMLWAAPRANPARSVGLQYRAEAAGEMSVELFDLSGRRLHRSERAVAAGETGVIDVPGATTGVLHYRLSLAAGGDHWDAAGRVVVVR